MKGIFLFFCSVAVISAAFTDHLAPHALISKAFGFISDVLPQSKKSPEVESKKIHDFGENFLRDEEECEEEHNPLARTNFTCVNFSHKNLPKVRHGHRVVDLFSGWHFDDLLLDVTDDMRPASVVAFYNSSDETCMKKYEELNFDEMAERKLPARSQLMTARYDMFSAPRRAWFEFTPEMDLEARFGVKSCPEIVFVSRKCDGYTEFCKRGVDEEDPSLTVYGCEDFKEQCPEENRKVWDRESDLETWIKENIEKDGRPKLNKFLGSYKEQGRWLETREKTTCKTHFRNLYISEAFPAYSRRGFKVLDIPEELNDWLLDFVERNEDKRKTEHWPGESTQMSFHEHPTTFIDTDMERSKKMELADKHLKPLLEEWTGIKPLKMTSFYGVREYHEDVWLRQHVDRIDTHVFSVTMSLGKRPFDKDKDKKVEDYESWPLQVTDWTGKQVSYDHPPGTMILYESSKLPHGRPLKNKGGVHLGAFVHYKPASMAKEWDELASRAKANQAKHTIPSAFKATREIEPSKESIEFVDDKNVEKVQWLKPGDAKRTKFDPNARKAKFLNSGNSDAKLFWLSFSGEEVFQGDIAAGDFMDINTFIGHRFRWKSSNGRTEDLEITKTRHKYAFV